VLKNSEGRERGADHVMFLILATQVRPLYIMNTKTISSSQSKKNITGIEMSLTIRAMVE
jgi:hypothetical protein